MVRNDLPFQIVVLADLTGQPEMAMPRTRDRRLVTLTRGSLPVALKAQRPHLKLRAPDADRSWDVRFLEPADFSEACIAQQIIAQGGGEGEARAVAGAARYNSAFCALCAAWNGLDFLLRAAEGKPEVVVRYWNISKRELLRDLQRASDFDQSNFFKRIYEEGIGTFGGGAVSLILADYPLSIDPNDIELADYISHVAASAYAPALFGAAPQYCRVDAWEELSPHFDAAWFNETTVTAKLRSFRLSENSRFTFALAGGFRRGVDGTGPPTGVWMNSVHLAGAAAIESFRDDTFGAGGWRLPVTPIDFEVCCGEGLARSLVEIGVNAMRSDAAPVSMQAMMTRAAGRPTEILRLLRECRLIQRLRIRTRQRGTWFGLEELADDARQWLAAAPETSDLGRCEIERRGNHMLLRIWCDATKPRSVWLTAPQYLPLEPNVAPLVRILVLADFDCGMERDEHPLPFAWRRAVAIDADRFDGVLEGYCAHSMLSLTAASVFSERFPVKVDFRVERLDDFDPENAVRQIVTCQRLLDERQRLVDTGALADARKGRWAGLSDAARRQGGLRGLACRLEAWASMQPESDTTPYPVEWLAGELGPWTGQLTADSYEVERQTAALLTYQLWAEERDGEWHEPERLCATLTEIDRLVSAQARPLFEDARFLQTERTWRALGALVHAIGKGTEVRTFEMDWYARSVEPVAEDWVLHRRLMKTLEDVSKPGFEEDKLVTLVVVDYRFDTGRPGLRSLRRVIERVRSKQLFVVCAMTPRSAGGEQGDLETADPIVRRLVTGKCGERVIVVTGMTMLRPGYAGGGGHAAIFSFNRGCEPLPPLYAASVYGAAANVAKACPALSRMLTAKKRCRAMRRTLLKAGMDCRPFGRAMVIWNTRGE